MHVLLTQLCFWCQVQLHPHHLPLLAHLKSCLDDSADSSAAAAAAKEAALQAQAAAGQAPAARSIIEGMLLPDTTAFATEFMTKSWAYGQGDPPGSAEEVKHCSGTHELRAWYNLLQQSHLKTSERACNQLWAKLILHWPV